MAPTNLSPHLQLVSSSDTVRPMAVSHGHSFAEYELDATYDEMFQAAGRSRPQYDALPFTPWMTREAGAPISDPDAAGSQQQDQQQ